MNIDNLLAKLDVLNNNYKWVISESNKIAEEVEKLDKEEHFNTELYEKYCRQFLELELRYANDKREFSKTFKEVKKYFKTKYGMDIVGMLEQEDIDNAK
jgi:hypothetical protein